MDVFNKLQIGFTLADREIPFCGKAKNLLWPVKVLQQVKELVAKPEDLSSSPGTTWGGEP